MSTGRSNYYPPRAGWRIVLRPISLPFRRWLQYSPVEVGSLNLSAPAILWSVIIPGYIFRVIGQSKIFLFIFGSYLFALFVFLAWLGQSAAGVAYMAMLSLHVTSVAQMIKHLTPDYGLKFRIVSTVTAFLLLSFLVYGLGQRILARHVMPLRINGEIVVVRACPLHRISAGDMVAYRVGGTSWDFVQTIPVRVNNGFGMDRVLATGGQTVQFEPTHFRVNGREFRKEPWMPDSGQVIVADGELFIWPSFQVSAVNMPNNDVSQAVLSYSRVSEENLAGKPCRYWFWRKQL